MNNTLPNSYFEDYPIEFKQINPSDFNEHYNVSEKIQISPNNDGYISDSLMPIYDNANLFNVAYTTDAVQHTLKKRPNSELGAFSIIYDEKNGEVVGVRVVTQDSSEIYLTEFGAKLLNKI